jgi:hypothetical protein
MTAVAERKWLYLPLVVLGGLLVGAVSYAQPRLLAGAMAAAVVAVVAWRRPVGNLVWIVFLTAVVPYGVQKLVGVSHPGLLPSDLLLIVGLGWAVTAWLSIRLAGRWTAYGLGLAVFIVFMAMQTVHGLRDGASLNDAGTEFRIQLALGAFFLSVPVLVDDRARPRLLRGLLIVAIALGVWGILQYTVNIPIAAFHDAGVRAGVALTSSGKGQVQGGLFGFGVAAIMCFSALLSGGLSPRARLAVRVALIVNLLGLLLTYERTFWVATAVGCLVVLVRAGRAARLRALLLAPVVIVVGLAGLAAVAPGELATARERFLSIGQYGSDSSVRYRLVESQHVVALISAHPIAGTGLGTRLRWGRPWERVPPQSTPYSHDGYLWLAWKVGVPLAALVFALWVSTLAWRAPPLGGALEHGLRNGAQAALLSLLVVSITFPAINTQSITATIGVLLALAVLPPAAIRRPGLVGQR